MKSNNFFQNLYKITYLVLGFILILFFQNCSAESFRVKGVGLDNLVSNSEDLNSQLDVPIIPRPNDDVPRIGISLPEEESAINVTTTATTTGKIYYVSISGNDANPGTLAKPFKTIARGSKVLASGDTLLIRAGTYNEVMEAGFNGFVFRNGKSKTAMTRYAAYLTEKVVVKAPVGRAYVVQLKSNSYIEISGLVFDGTNATSYAVKFDEYSINNRLLRNELVYGRMGIAGGAMNEIIGNRIHHMKAYGIYTGGDNGLLEGNTFHDNGGYAIHHFQQNKTVNNWVFRNNIFYRNGRGYYWGGTDFRKAPAVIISRGKNNKFYNNILYDNNAGIFVGYGAVDTLVANNTVYRNDTNGIDVNSAHSGSINARIINNLVWANKSSQITNNATNTTLKTNLTTDPKVVSPGVNFRLQSSSPAINKGTTLVEVPKDFLGVSRPRGSAYDIGAYEY